jgi:nucleotide-binding universal stress UspA family protein
MAEGVDALVDAASRAPEVIVVGLDIAEIDREGPQPSRDAAAYAAGLSRREGTRLVGVWVRPPVAYGDTFAETAETIARRREEAETQLRARATAAEQHYGLPPGCIMVREGDPARELLRAAEEVNADGIVVGASTERIGSVAGHVIRHARVPVTVVP